MPLYLFACEECNQKFEKLLSYSQIQDVRCVHCGSQSVKRIYNGATVFGGAVPAKEPASACQHCCPGCPNAKQ